MESMQQVWKDLNQKMTSNYKETEPKIKHDSASSHDHGDHDEQRIEL